ncbi:MAG: ATP-binding protein [Candidatus Limnocylindrales bacterium]|nr:ATP-binding protein [Candidatus Limnocylindrales bacterium]
MTSRVVRERIDPRLTASLFANYRSAIDALLELVDNAVDSRVPDRPLRVDLVVRPESIVLTAIGGTGMGPTELERDYLRWGASRKRAGDRIGRYGQGGKAAIGHLGNRFTVTASRAGDERAITFEDPAYRDRTKLRVYELHDRAKPVDAELGYVRIEIGDVDRKVDLRRLPGRLAEVYRPLLEGEALALTVNRAPVVVSSWKLAERHEVAVRAGGRIVRGWYGLLPDPAPPTVEPGIRIYHLGRLIGAPEWFGHPGPALHPGMNRLVGEVELPHVPVTMNKSDVDRDSPEWIAVEARLHALLAPVVRRLAREGSQRVDPGALRTADQVRRILARALRLLESGKLFESELGTGGGEGPGGQLTLAAAAAEDAPDEAEPTEETETGAQTPEGEAERLPRAPRRAGAGSGRGVGEVVVRALDLRLRSAMVVEDGVRRIVINSRYPLYEVRRGDLWYQLETALREVCVTIPEATVPEFERKVNELMLVSLSLTGRPKRRKSRATVRQSKGAWAG